LLRRHHRAGRLPAQRHHLRRRCHICIGGWLKSCTPANYWKAVGYCKNDDDAGGVTPIRFPSGRDESEAPAAVPAAATVAR